MNLAKAACGFWLVGPISEWTSWICQLMFTMRDKIHENLASGWKYFCCSDSSINCLGFNLSKIHLQSHILQKLNFTPKFKNFPNFLATRFLKITIPKHMSLKRGGSNRGYIIFNFNHPSIYSKWQLLLIFYLHLETLSSKMTRFSMHLLRWKKGSTYQIKSKSRFRKYLFGSVWFVFWSLQDWTKSFGNGSI